MANYAVSIVVPIYKVEKYLKRCIDSLLAQTLTNIEIILVDDGSPDNCPQMCDEYARQYPDKVKVLHQKNQGVSVARNNGIAITTGEYIGFVDSDDWVAKNMFEKMYKVALEDELQLVACGYYEVRKNTITAKKAFNGSCDTVKEILTQVSPAYSCNKIFHKSLKPQLIYPAGIALGEDVCMLLPVYSYLKNFTVIEDPLYYYFRRDDSATANLKKINIAFTFIYANKIALELANPVYQKEVAYLVAQRFYSAGRWTLNYYDADSIEFVQENFAFLFNNNQYILNDPKVRPILSYFNSVTIPKTIVYPNFGKELVANYQQTCINSWSEFTRDFTFVELHEENCDLSSAPASVKAAYNCGDTKFVGDYFKLQYICEHGGIALDTNIKLCCPIGHLRTEKTFFGFMNKEEINDGIFGSQKGTGVLKELLNTYEENDLFNENFLPLNERIRDLLIYKYAFRNKGWTQTLKNDVKVFRCDILSCDMQGGANVAKIYSPISLELEDTEFEIIEKSVLKYWDDDKNNFWKQKEGFRKELEEAKRKLALPPNKPITDNALVDRVRTLEQELEWHRGEILRYKNSKSWRITRPLRRFINLFRKNKFTKDEVR